MDWILVVDLGHLCLIDIFWLFGFCEWMDERAICQIIDIFCYCFCLLDFYLKLVGLRLLIFFYHPWTLRTMSNLGLGVHLRSAIVLGFKLCAKNFKIFAILPYLSMLCLLRLFFLCIFASVWFRLTPCHLGCHWTKCVNLLSNLLKG